MVYTYKPAYYNSVQDSITSWCKNILPFSFKKKRLTAIAAAEQRLSNQQAENLKWQQESFHQILKLMGLSKEGIVPESEVSAFKSHLMETLIASPLDYEHSTILRDKLVFLQELLYAKCISEDEYHSSKRPLLQRLAVQGAEIDARDVIASSKKEPSDEEWSVVDLKDERSNLSKENSISKNKAKQIKGVASALGFGSSSKSVKAREDYSERRTNEMWLSTENPFWDNGTKSILMPESLPNEMPNIETSGGDKGKRKPFRSLFQKEQNDPRTGDSGKKPWGFEGLRKWKKNDSDDETLPLALNEKSSNVVQSPVGNGGEPDTKEIKKKLHPDGAPSDFFVDKVLGENIKKKLTQIKSELDAKNPKVHLSDEQIEVISTRLPVDKADLKMFFPKPWCDKYSDVVLDVVRKEFKDHVGEMGREKKNSKRWTTFEEDDDENTHPNLFAPEKNLFSNKSTVFAASPPIATSRSIENGFKYNPFFDV